MRHRIESVDLTQKIKNIAIKIDNIEDKFDRLREDCAANIFSKLEVKMGNLRQDVDREHKEQELYEVVHEINNSIERNMILMIEKQIILNKFYVLKSKSREHILNSIIAEQEEVLKTLKQISRDMQSEVDCIKRNRQILEENL